MKENKGYTFSNYTDMKYCCRYRLGKRRQGTQGRRQNKMNVVTNENRTREKEGN